MGKKSKFKEYTGSENEVNLKTRERENTMKNTIAKKIVGMTVLLVVLVTSIAANAFEYDKAFQKNVVTVMNRNKERMSQGPLHFYSAELDGDALIVVYWMDVNTNDFTPGKLKEIKNEMMQEMKDDVCNWKTIEDLQDAYFIANFEMIGIWYYDQNGEDMFHLIFDDRLCKK